MDFAIDEDTFYVTKPLMVGVIKTESEEIPVCVRVAEGRGRKRKAPDRFY